MKFYGLLFCVSLLTIWNCKNDGKRNSIVYDDGIIHIDNVVYDFGYVYKDAKDSIKFFFILKNLSCQIVTIQAVDPSCNCIKVNDYKREIEPGKDWVLSGWIEKKEEVENFNKPLFVKYNKGVVLLRIKGTVE